MQITPLEQWLCKKIGLAKLDLSALRQYQLQALKQNFAYVCEKSPFYRSLYQGLKPIENWADFEKLPLISQTDLQAKGSKMLCVEQDEIHRIVTLDTSGTVGKPKRVYFTKADQELTANFFDVGMQTMAKAGDKVLILLPCARPGSVGDLLSEGLRRFGALPLTYGAPVDLEQTARYLGEAKPDVIVANPKQMLAIAEIANQSGSKTKVRAVLLSTDYVPEALTKRLEKLLGCQVFEHYGMTETGLGGGVSCAALDGCHLREADLYFEIIHPQSGMVMPWGEYGEVVFSTLTREAMPLLRYRTGDYGRFLSDSCSCGSFLPRLDKVGHRLPAPGQDFKITDFDEALLAIDGIVDFAIEVETAKLKIFLTVFTLGQTIDVGVILNSIAHLANGFEISVNLKLELPQAQTVLRKRKIKYLA